MGSSTFGDRSLHCSCDRPRSCNAFPHAEVPEIVVRHVSVVSVCLLLSGRYEVQMDIGTVFVTPSSRKRFWKMSSEPVWEPCFGTFRSNKAVFAGPQNITIFDFFVLRSEFGTFRSSKVVFADLANSKLGKLQ